MSTRSQTPRPADTKQFVVRRLLSQKSYDGMTAAELRVDQRFAHNGSASAVLSNLHKAGVVERLADKRDGYKIYVLPLYVGSRPTEAHASSKKAAVVEVKCTCRCQIHAPD